MSTPCMSPGTAAKRNMLCQWLGSETSGTPATTATRMPTQIMSWFSDPSVPLSCAGDTSAMYIGTRLDEAPIPTPASRRPSSMNHTLFAKPQRTLPRKRGAATPTNAVLLPTPSAMRPLYREPTVAPTRTVDTTRPFSCVLSAMPRSLAR